MNHASTATTQTSSPILRAPPPNDDYSVGELT
jgi:hypothetical protein